MPFPLSLRPAIRVLVACALLGGPQLGAAPAKIAVSALAAPVAVTEVGGPVAAAAAAAAGPSGPATVAELAARVATLMQAPRFAGAAWGVKVVSLDTGATLVEHQAHQLLSPASNCKLYVGALALDRLGGDDRIVTPVYATARPDAAGVVAGDVIIAGRGDPSWRLRPGGATTVTAAVAPVVAAVRAAGVRRVTGAIVADGTWLRMAPYGAGWTAEDLSDYYGAEISGVALADNCARLQYAPGAAVGAAAVLTWLDPLADLALENQVVTVPAPAEPAGGQGRGAPVTRFYTQRFPGERTVRAWGELSLGAAPRVEDIPVPRPADWAAAVVRAALIEAGVAVEGGSRGVRWPEASPLAPRVGAVAGGAPVPIGEVVSPPLRELVKDFMKPSQNLQTDLLFAQVGERTRPAGAPAWRTSEQCAVAAMEEFLRAKGLPAAEVRLEEGSGLSRNNLVTAHATAALLAAMAQHPAAADYRASLPIAGVDGTLRSRFKGTAAEGQVQAKTGSLRWAASLSGYTTTAAGERLAFSFMLNRYVPPEGRSARTELDALTLWLVGLRGRSLP